MNYDATLLNYFIQASLVVKCVMLLLIAASIFSWSCILQRFFYLKKVSQAASVFERSFWSGQPLGPMYTDIRTKNEPSGIETIFCAGFKEYLRMIGKANLALVIENTKRGMRVAQMREQDKLESNLAFLAIVGSTSPYIGLFGTVWGIMQAFRALANNVSQATIAMVAPGIAEALIATALGLFAAIPAVIAYNRFLTDSGKLMNRYDAFQEELINVLIRKSQDDKIKQASTIAEEVSARPRFDDSHLSGMDLIENTAE